MYVGADADRGLFRSCVSYALGLWRLLVDMYGFFFFVASVLLPRRHGSRSS